MLKRQFSCCFTLPERICQNILTSKLVNSLFKRTLYVKFLCVMMDEQSIFFKVRHHVPLPTLICLYNSLFSSFLNYGSSAWGLTYETYLNPLFRLQKKILRAINFQPFSAPSSPIFHSLRILKLQDVLRTNILTFVYKSFNELSPYFHDYF